MSGVDGNKPFLFNLCFIAGTVQCVTVIVLGQTDSVVAHGRDSWLATDALAGVVIFLATTVHRRSFVLGFFTIRNSTKKGGS